MSYDSLGEGVLPFDPSAVGTALRALKKILALQAA